MPSFNYYRGACVELDLYGLAVCAIMSSGELDAEGLTTLAMAGGTGGSSGSGAAGAVSQVCLLFSVLVCSVLLYVAAWQRKELHVVYGLVLLY